ncbi:putative nitroreductase [Malassezia pachydermatis]|uniref:Nitroreductase family protein n=1 Tax=Malassezia pachydermatis TaxID=77020 RepID=A0A0M8MSX8_9BASI|nr:nitroreductase family protein [Malassezia pachydermatis]KOS13704.1 nitroreductase family protein [Malassezia pachydermatis]
MASTTASKQFLQVIQNRRTVYALSKKAVLPDAELIKYVQSLVKEAPSAFNVMSSRLVVLLGAEHDKYWGETVPAALRAVAGEEAVAASKDKLAGFKAGYGTILFFEDEKLIKGQQEAFPQYAAGFPVWSQHASGMGQIYVWSGLEAVGYGVNLQHYGGLTGETLKKQYNLPASYLIQSEMVFGYPEQPAGEKAYHPDHERVIAYGHSA